MRHTTRKLLLNPLTTLVVAGLWVCVSVAADSPGQPQPTTTSDPAIPTAELALLLTPLSKDELLVEAEAWRAIVRAKAEEIARAEIAVRRQNIEIRKAGEISQKTQEVREKLEVITEKVEEAKATGDAEKIAEAEEVASSAQESIQEVQSVVSEAVDAVRRNVEIEKELGVDTRQHLEEMVSAAEKAEKAVADVGKAIGSGDEEDAPRVTEAAEQAKRATDEVDEKLLDSAKGVAAAEKAAALEQAVAVVEKAEEIRKAEKIDLLEIVTRLREQRTRLLDNLRAVVDELEIKTDQADSDTQAKIRDYRLYLAAVSGIHVDVTDTTSAWVSVKGWITSEEGGKRWIINVGTFAGILVAAWFLAKLLSRMTQKATARVRLPALPANFLVAAIRWVVMIVGTVWALTALEVSIAPLLALFGAASFIIAFAMQDSLSNFASGLMILFFRPFDMGDVIEAGGVSGKVSSVNLVSTTIRTFDNKLMVVPNSKIWSDVITNATGVTERRVDLEFGIGYSDDIEHAQKILEEIVADHPAVLKQPEPVVRLSALADSSVNFICRPWTRPADYWDVYWDITKEVKKRFDAEGIGIPFPQRDVHLYVEQGEAAAPGVDLPRPGAPAA